jgi:hypothetical protein
MTIKKIIRRPSYISEQPFDSNVRWLKVNKEHWDTYTKYIEELIRQHGRKPKIIKKEYLLKQNIERKVVLYERRTIEKGLPLSFHLQEIHKLNKKIKNLYLVSSLLTLVSALFVLGIRYYW